MFLRYIKMYFNLSFSGRASSREFTFLYLLDIFIFIVLAIALPWAWFIYIIFFLLHGNALVVRRGHDIASKKINIFNKSNWSKFYYVESDHGSNQFGAEPWDSNWNLRILRNKKNIDQLFLCAKKNNLLKLKEIINQMGCVSNGYLSFDLLEYFSDDRALYIKNKKFLLSDVCLYVLIMQLLPPHYYWDKVLFSDPYRKGSDLQMHLRPFTFNDDFLQMLFSPKELMCFLDENQTIPLVLLRKQVIQRVIDQERQIGFYESELETKIMESMNRLLLIVDMI